MYARILKFLANLAFKPLFFGFLTSRKKREPMQWGSCCICGYGFLAFNKRQRVCKKKSCIKTDRAAQYRKRLEWKRAEAGGKAKQEPFNKRFDPTCLESEE